MSAGWGAPPIIWGDVSRPAADEGPLVGLCAIAHHPADEGYVNPPGDDAALVRSCAMTYPETPSAGR
jgi:hypothetical protein